MIKKIIGEVEVCKGIPKGISDSKMEFLSRSHPDIKIEDFLVDEKPNKTRNRVLYTGKQMLLHMIFFNVTFSVNKFFVGDGASLFFAGEPLDFSFPNQGYPQTAEQVKEIGRAHV